MTNPDIEHETVLVLDMGDRLQKPWNLVQLFRLNTFFRDTFLSTQGRNVLFLATTPQYFDARNWGVDRIVLRGRVKDKEPDGVITSGLKTQVGENMIRPARDGWT